MARLPDPVAEQINVGWPEREEWAARSKDFDSVIGQAIRKAVAAEKNGKEEGESDNLTST